MKPAQSLHGISFGYNICAQRHLNLQFISAFVSRNALLFWCVFSLLDCKYCYTCTIGWWDGQYIVL